MCYVVHRIHWYFFAVVTDCSNSGEATARCFSRPTLTNSCIPLLQQVENGVCSAVPGDFTTQLVDRTYCNNLQMASTWRKGPFWAFLLTAIATVSAHVALTFPPARKYDLDFLDTFR